MPKRPATHQAARARAPVHVAPQQQRASAAARGYDSRWKKARDGYLAKHPLCAHCASEGRVEPARVVDHVIPHKGDKALFWDSSNWQPLCKRHHDRKTATEDGGWGNPRRA
jgi:5-methylcytosine-specific restriction protein A